MGFISPRMPDFDLDEWRTRPHHRRIEPLAQDWARHGFGTPAAIFVVHLVKVVVFAGGAVLVLGATPGLNGDFSSWWSDPIAYQKFVVWTLLWEILGLGCGSMPLTFRFRPPFGGFLYWTRLGTMRLAPWPTRIPFTAGTRREPIDVALYLTVLASAVGMWWAAATSKLNRHFPFVASVMIGNTPWHRSTWLTRTLWRHYPDDLRPSSLSTRAAHAGTAVEFVVPLVLLLSRGGAVTMIALTIMVLFHVHITSTFPLGVPLEWNVFFIYSTVFLFGHYASVGAGSLDSSGLPVLLALILIGLPVLGNVAPRLVSVLPSMRDHAGNGATSVWLFRNDGAEEHFDGSVTKCAPILVKQLRRLYDDDVAELLLYKGLAVRSLHPHGRALNGLMTRAVDDLADYTPREGERRRRRGRLELRRRAPARRATPGRDPGAGRFQPRSVAGDHAGVPPDPAGRTALPDPRRGGRAARSGCRAGRRHAGPGAVARRRRRDDPGVGDRAGADTGRHPADRAYAGGRACYAVGGAETTRPAAVPAAGDRDRIDRRPGHSAAAPAEPTPPADRARMSDACGAHHKDA